MIWLVLCALLMRSAYAARDEFALERFEIEKLEVKRTITRGDCRFAYVKAPDGALYLLSVGDYIGKNDGLVVKIESDVVLVRELIRAKDRNEWIPRETRLEAKR